MTLLDVGARTEARKEHLVQFAFMGAALAQVVLGVERPRVGVLSNGEESERGSALVVAARAELEERVQAGGWLELVGNVEGSDVDNGSGGCDCHRWLHGQCGVEADGGCVTDDAGGGARGGDVLATGEAGGVAAAPRIARFS